MVFYLISWWLTLSLAHTGPNNLKMSNSIDWREMPNLVLWKKGPMHSRMVASNLRSKRHLWKVNLRCLHWWWQPVRWGALLSLVGLTGILWWENPQHPPTPHPVHTRPHHHPQLLPRQLPPLMMEETRTARANRSLAVYGECFGLTMLDFWNSITYVAMLNKYLYLEDFIYKFDRWIFLCIYFIQ